MKGPIQAVRSGKISGLADLGRLHEWSEGPASLVINQVSFNGKKGAVLCYCNRPVHQVGNPALDAFLQGLDKVFQKKEELEFLLLYGANDPVHAGGDLKESLEKLDKTLATKKEKQRAGAPAKEIDELYDWADRRLEKGVGLHSRVRRLAQHLRVVAACGGGTRFGGSAEIPLMADYLVGDSRSGMCFSEAMIGLLPGWSGAARALVKAGLQNARAMALTAKEVKANQLKAIGIYTMVVEVPFGFPRMPKTGDPKADKAAYAEALEKHDEETGMLLLPRGLEMATCPPGAIPQAPQRAVLVKETELAEEVKRRSNPQTYAHLLGKPVKEVNEEVGRLGRPLAPQSIEALSALFNRYDASRFDEAAFVKEEADADARLYRDPRFRAGLVATLEQRVADYREVS
jgi:enoyl-CoA hydratase/carnithine racemase